jgi:hypothetical protein
MIPIAMVASLTLPYFEHLGAAGRAHTLGRRLAILHGNGLGILHFFLGAALHTVSLHFTSPLLIVLAKQAITRTRSCQEYPAYPVGLKN